MTMRGYSLAQQRKINKNEARKRLRMLGCLLADRKLLVEYVSLGLEKETYVLEGPMREFMTNETGRFSYTLTISGYKPPKVKR
jgi:hypothetical protein